MNYMWVGGWDKIVETKEFIGIVDQLILDGISILHQIMIFISDHRGVNQI